MLVRTRSGLRNLTRSLRENAALLATAQGTRHFLYSLADFFLASAYGSSQAIAPSLDKQDKCPTPQNGSLGI